MSRKHLSDEFVKGYADREAPFGFNGLGYATFKRTYARPIFEGDTVARTEEWHETVERVVNGAQDIGAGLTADEAERLFDHIFNLRGTVAGRMLWQLGTPNNTRLGGDSLVNCWYVDLQSVEDFSWMFERLMLGGGVGFGVSKPWSLGQVSEVAPPVVHLPDAKDADFIVPDKREGWAELLERVLRAYLETGEGFTYSTVLIRPEGAPIKTFGGTASGPGILVEGVEHICKVLDAATGRYLTATEVLDIANLIGSIVVSGNVRRSAQIAIGSPFDEEFLQAKRWDLGSIPFWRAMSNNSVAVPDDVRPGEALGDLFWEAYEGKGEPYGLVNVDAAKRWGRTGEHRPDPSIEGFNPCAEIGLAHRESCNLAEIFLPNIESEEQMIDVAQLLYKVQKAVASLPYLDRESDVITTANMRLGLGVTGVAMATAAQLDWLSPTYDFLRAFDVLWSMERGWPTSVRLTTVKPSGTLSLLAGVTPGVHPGWSRFHVRRVRMASNDPVFEWCKQKGYDWEFARNFDGEQDARTVIVEFPVELPEGTPTADETGALDLLRTQAFLQKVWSDNAVSITVTFKPEELDDIRAYLNDNWHITKSVSFLPYSDHGFDQAPYSEVSKDEYLDRLGRINRRRVDVGAGESDLLGADCEGGACPLR